MDAYERVRDAYVRDRIDLAEFERLVDGLLGDRPFALPIEFLYHEKPVVSHFTAALKEMWTDGAMNEMHDRLNARDKRVFDALG